MTDNTMHMFNVVADTVAMARQRLLQGEYESARVLLEGAQNSYRRYRHEIERYGNTEELAYAIQDTQAALEERTR